MLRNMTARMIALAVGFALMVAVVPGVSSNGFGSILISALVYMVINATAGRVLKFVTAPLALLTLGLSILGINLLVLMATEVLVDSLDIDGAGAFVLATVFLSVVSFVVNFVLTRRRRRRR